MAVRLGSRGPGWRGLALGAGMTLLHGCGAPATVEAPVGPGAGDLPMPPACTCPAWPRAASRFDSVVTVVLENKDYEQVMSNRTFHDLATNALGLPTRSAYFVDFHGLFHPSYGNYLAMVAGKQIPTSRDRQKTVGDCTVVDLMASRHREQGDDLTWRSYAEGYPDDKQCHLEPSIGRYARKHVPLLSFGTIQDDPGKCENVRAARHLGDDERAGRLPSYAFFTPDLVDDAHDGSLDESAAWLAGFVRDLVGSPAWTKRTLLIVSFDEFDGRSSNDDNHIYTVLLGDMIKAGPIAGRHDHYDILRLIEGNFGLCPLGAGDGAAEPIVDLWPAP